MPILLYCVAQRGQVPGRGEIRGVARNPVHREEFGHLAVFISREEDSARWLKQELGTSALEFHGVLQELFRQFAVIPFRFPTVFDSEAELTKHLDASAGEYSLLLEKFKDLVQMEARIAAAEPPSFRQSGGAEFLRRRQNASDSLAEFAGELEKNLSDLTAGWRLRRSRDGLRAFALIGRDAVTDFKDRIRGQSIPAGLRIRVSGPWPVSEFIDHC
jgi:Gas vesicle synthesis protein GvpL/GvpF